MTLIINKGKFLARMIIIQNFPKNSIRIRSKRFGIS